jgi:hypothetical protein
VRMMTQSSDWSSCEGRRKTAVSSMLLLEAQFCVLESIPFIYRCICTRPEATSSGSPIRDYYIPRFAVNGSSGNADIFAYAEDKSKITMSRDSVSVYLKIEEFVQSRVYRH